jgi:hypothetical protein
MKRVMGFEDVEPEQDLPEGALREYRKQRYRIWQEVDLSLHFSVDAYRQVFDVAFRVLYPLSIQLWNVSSDYAGRRDDLKAALQARMGFDSFGLFIPNNPRGNLTWAVLTFNSKRCHDIAVTVLGRGDVQLHQGGTCRSKSCLLCTSLTCQVVHLLRAAPALELRDVVAEPQQRQGPRTPLLPL